MHVSAAPPTRPQGLRTTPRARRGLDRVASGMVVERGSVAVLVGGVEQVVGAEHEEHRDPDLAVVVGHADSM